MRTPAPTVSPRLRRAAIAAGVVVVLVVLVLSHSFGRAVPTNNYRPMITTDAIESGCFPLPGDAHLDGLSYQVRWDEDVDVAGRQRRLLRGQYNLVERDEAERLLVKAFTNVGFTRAKPDDDLDGADMIWLARGDQRVGLSVTELPDTSAETLVRGEFRLDLPVATNARPDDPICTSETSTKRWNDPGQR